jgi:outer membrane receptor for ferrienterochelin and colicin
VPGTYTVTVSAAAFKGLQDTKVVHTGTVNRGDEKLTVGAAGDTVTVTTGALQVNTDQIGVGGTVTQEKIDTKPVNGRNILDVARIQPGVILQSGITFDPTKAGYSALSVSGAGGRTRSILLDGQDITDETVGTTVFNVPTSRLVRSNCIAPRRISPALLPRPANC